MSFLHNLYLIQQEHWLLFFFATLTISLCVGSFLNVVIYRLPEMMQREWQIQARLILEPDEVEKEKILKEEVQKMVDIQIGDRQVVCQYIELPAKFY